MAEPKSEVIQALGRPFQLGRLYDIRRDVIINRSLWNQSDLTEDKITSIPSDFNDFKINTSNKIDESFKLMDISASLKMSFLGGLVDVSGSAKYLDKRNTKSNSTSVTMMHYMTTETKSLGEEQTSNVTYKNLLDLDDATHVITGITYGARAYFKFEKTVEVHESEKDISGKLAVAVNNIPSFKISGEGSVDMSDDEKKNSENISCQFVGDYTNIGIPTNFEEAIKVFKKIDGSENGDNGRNVVPISIYLTPLHQLDSKAGKLVREISENAVDQCSDLMNYHREVETKLNTLKSSITAQYYPEFFDFVQKVEGQFSIMANDLKSNMAQILPTIRGGGAEEQELLQIVMDFQATIFAPEYFNKWFKLQEDEVKTTDDFLTYLEDNNIKVVKTKGELRRQMNTEKDIVALTAGFVSYHNKQLLADLAENSKDHSADYDYPINDNVWMDDDAFYGRLLKQREEFLNTSKGPKNKANFVFLFDFRHGVEENYCTTKFYKRGVLVEENLDCGPPYL